MLCVCNAESEAGPGEDRLLKRFFYDSRYYPTSRPVANDSDTVPVRFSVQSVATFELVSAGNPIFTGRQHSLFCRALY